MSNLQENQTTILGEDLKPNSDNDSNQNINQDVSSTIVDKTNEENYLANLVGEGKKYATIEDAAKALAKKATHADSFIETLKTEKKILEEQLSSSKKVDDILSVLNQKQDSNIQTALQQPPTAIKVEAKEQPDIRETINSLLDERAELEKKNKELGLIKSNQKKAWDLLAKKFGGMDNAKLIVRKYINNDSTKANIISQIGSYQPEELVTFLEVKKDSLDFNPTVKPTTRIISEFDEIVTNLTWSKAREIKKENPKLYRSHKFQQMMHEAAAKDPNFLNK